MTTTDKLTDGQWLIQHLEDDAEACSAVNGSKDITTKDARRAEVTVKRLIRERDDARRALQAAPAPSDVLRVKPLDWKQYGDKGGVVALCRMTRSEYAAWPNVQYAGQVALRGPWRGFTYHPSVEDAKAAAQAHYDAGILSCLAPSDGLRDQITGGGA